MRLKVEAVILVAKDIVSQGKLFIAVSDPLL
jgi:hypothetical protein